MSRPPAVGILRREDILFFDIKEHHRVLLKILKQGTLPARCYIFLVENPDRKFTTIEIADQIGSHRQHVHKALTFLEGEGLVERPSRHTFKVKCHVKRDGL